MTNDDMLKYVMRSLDAKDLQIQGLVAERDALKEQLVRTQRELQDVIQKIGKAVDKKDELL